MKTTRAFSTAAIQRYFGVTIAAALASVTTSSFAAEPAETLKAYEKVSQALIGDDLAGTKQAAADLATKAEPESTLAQEATELSTAGSLSAARDHFKTVSEEAIKLAEGKEGYYVMTCFSPWRCSAYVRSIAFTC